MRTRTLLAALLTGLLLVFGACEREPAAPPPADDMPLRPVPQAIPDTAPPAPGTPDAAPTGPGAAGDAVIENALGPVVNTVCPVGDHEFDPDSPEVVKVSYQGKTYGLCCADCLPEFKANPARYAQSD